MKNILIAGLFLIALVAIILNGCKKNELSLTDSGLNSIKFNPNLGYGTMTDKEGNKYKTITIGTQTWMAENLRTTKYRNGDPISNVTDFTAWAKLATGAYCYYNNEAATYKATYGALYNGFAVTDSRNIAPEGWHVPTDAEWTTLTDYLGGERVAGGKLKETGTFHWLTPDTGTTNSSGFTALPGGSLDYEHDNYFFNVGYVGHWWSTTGNLTNYAWIRYVTDGSFFLRSEDVYNYGFSVRCLRD